MAKKIVMPKLAMAMNEGTVTTWSFIEGAQVEKGSILLEIETEKVSYEIEAIADGFLHIVVPAGETVPVEALIGYLAADSDELASLQSDTRPDTAAREPAAEIVVANQEVVAAAKATGHVGRIIASPLAKKMATQHGLDLSKLNGSGPNGRIVKRDILAAIAGDAATPLIPAAVGERKVKAVVPVKGMRKAIADNMMLSLSTSAQLSFTQDFDMTEIMQLRNELVSKEEMLGYRVSYMDLIALILSKAVKQVPIVNASLIDNEIKVWEDINLGIAVATEINSYEYGLIVPVVKNIGHKTLADINADIKDLTGKARDNRLSPEEMSDGTITLSSAAFIQGLVCSTPVLSPGQAMLIQPGQIEEQVVARDGEIVIRPIMKINFTCDHRIVDGFPAGKFAGKIKELIECPGLLL